MATKLRYLLAALALTLVATACGETDDGSTQPTTPDNTCTGKCDNTEGSVRLISSLSMSGYTSEGGESESFRLVGEVAEAYYFDVAQDQKLNVEIFANDGASNPDFKITAQMVYEEDGVGAFISDTIDTSLLLPWQVINVRLTGTHANKTVDQTFEFKAGDEVGTELVANATIAPLATLSMIQYRSEAGELEQFALYADVADEYYGSVPDEHTLQVELYANDGASNPDYKIASTITYDADNVGGYTSDVIDTSMLLPWLSMEIRVFGELGGEFVDQTFAFEPGNMDGKPVGVEVASIDLLGTLSMLDYASADGESESFVLYADVAEAHYFDVPDGHQLQVEAYAADGASNPDFRIQGGLTYDEDAVGGYTSDKIDTSLLLPWQLMRIRVFGALDGASVDQTFEFLPGQTEGALVE